MGENDLWLDPLDHSDFCSDFFPGSFSMNLVHIISDMRRVYMYIYTYILHRMFQSFIDKLPEQLPVEGDVTRVASLAFAVTYFLHIIIHLPFDRLSQESRAVFGTPTLWKLAKGF